MFFRQPNWKYLKYAIQERWGRLVVRKWINNNPRIMVGIALVSAVALLMTVIGQCMPDNVPEVGEYKKAWFYDLNTGELFVARSYKLPPIKAPSGPLPNGEPAGVKAYVFSYAQEPNESERFIGYLEKLTPEGKKYMSSFQKSRDNVTKESVRQLNKNRLIRRVTDEQWFSADSNEGQAITKEVFLPNENGQAPYYCSPK